MRSGLIIPGRAARDAPGAFYRGASNGSVTFPRFATGTGAFAISFWYYSVGAISGKNFVGVGDSGDGAFFQSNSANITFAGAANYYIGSTAGPTDQWAHVELNRDGSGNMRMFINGVLDATGTVSNSASFGTTGGDWKIGGSTTYGQANSMNYIDELAVLIGDVFHSGTSSFTPETAAYTSAHAKYASMYALLHFDEAVFVDYSTYARTITMVGTAAQDTATFKF